MTPTQVVNYNFRSVVAWNRRTQSEQPVDLEVTVDWAALAHLLAVNCQSNKTGRTQLQKGIVRARLKR